MTWSALKNLPDTAEKRWGGAAQRLTTSRDGRRRQGGFDKYVQAVFSFLRGHCGMPLKLREVLTCVSLPIAAEVPVSAEKGEINKEKF